MSDDYLVATRAIGTAFHVWAQPRIELSTGCLASYALRIDTAANLGFAPMTDALHAACALAVGANTCVSVDIVGPFPAVPGLTLAALRHSGAEPHQIELSTTVEQLADAGPDAAPALVALRAMGAGVALTGFNPTAVPHLRGLTLSRAVLAAELLQDVPASRAANAQLHAIVNIARREGLRVSATGVETETQRAVLSGFGCEQGEGTLFGPAHPVHLEHREAA